MTHVSRHYSLKEQERYLFFENTPDFFDTIGSSLSESDQSLSEKNRILRESKSFERIFIERPETITTREVSEAYAALYEKIPSEIRGKFKFNTHEVNNIYTSTINYRNADNSRPRFRISVQIANYGTELFGKSAEHLPEHDSAPILIVLDGTPNEVITRKNPEQIRMRYIYLPQDRFVDMLREIVIKAEKPEGFSDDYFDMMMQENPETGDMEPIKRMQ